MPRRKAVVKSSSKSPLKFFRSIPTSFLVGTIVMLELMLLFVSQQSSAKLVNRVSERNSGLETVASDQRSTPSSAVAKLAVVSGMEAGWVLGQPDFTTGINVGDPNYGAVQPPTANSMYFPEGVAFDSVQKTLFVADGANNRVLVYLNTVPGSNFNNRPADRVFGQASLTSGEINTACGGGSSGSVNACGLSRPSALWFDASANRLWISDVNNYRVVGIDLPTSHASISSGPAWTYVLGQPNFVSATINNPCGGGVGGNNTSTNSCGFDYPIGVSGAAGRLFVADNDNQRVLVFDTGSITNGESAVGVLGKADFVTRGTQTTQAGLGLVCDVDFDTAKSRLYVADCQNNRVMVWESFNPASFSNGAPASKVLGQPDFTTATANTACGGGSNGAGNACGLWEPYGVSFDTANNRMFLADGSNSRLLIFDDTSLVNGEAAVNVLGQPNLTTIFNAYDLNVSSSSVSRSLMRGVDDIYYDALADHIYVADSFNHRVMIYGLHFEDQQLVVNGGVGFTDGNTVSISSNGNQTFAVVFPNGTTPIAPNTAITISVSDVIRNIPAVTINADLPAGETKTISMPWYNHDLCIRDVPGASVTRGNSCSGGVRVTKNKFDAIGECANWKPGETVCHVGNMTVITGLNHTALFSVKEKEKGENDKDEDSGSDSHSKFDSRSSRR
ncbi:MAG: hypothetical protein A2534_03215 [Candidatus Magasanikbacteria bacterium RIFOXYD2_FULL_39_9]|uniref:SMP-30/Gluconolactonase/LRE-like region domain-containing protein n=1 Tax=Candidatus Magasanikbacteria bacterium RIFOXYD1_FULL_40_23 TaxID=1798705 RepID=A0A1F6PAN7_9BACT|nr:MAG: hypothetical protein A2534_03215 [Candidatus Magasanikbacteria bacterium RIFOXYD2_FULL_39_9]OGH93100.1 MAG: hypothetical protein A2563_00220 [Candidatus Magasanikbacteria bacterium RIFOXYD1_FULL_40_23]